MANKQNMEVKGNTVRKATFANWGYSSILDWKEIEENGATLVNFVWCKICSRNENCVLRHPSIKGASKLAAHTFITGTHSVTKHSIERHLKGKCHEIALEIESGKDKEDQLDLDGYHGPSQPKLSIVQKDVVSDVYKRLLITAYELALKPTMALNHFSMLVNIQRRNGVCFIEGNHDHRTARKLIISLKDAVLETCTEIVKSKHFLSVLSDGSQARKTNDDKEMILTRIERDGKPTYLVSGLLQMAELRGSGAEAIKTGIDSVYDGNNGTVKCVEFKTKLESCTADGASVNFGQYEGLLNRLENDGRPWLVKIHCANHRIELAVKSAFAESTLFANVDKFYIAIFNLHKNSGAIKSDVKKAAEVLNISSYTLPKMTGTRFVSHRRRALRHLLDMWPALITAYANTIVVRRHKAETKAKIEGFIKQLRSYEFLYSACTYLDLLEKITPCSLVFEGDGLMPFEIKPAVSLTSLELEDLAETAGQPEELLDSHLSRFQLLDEEEGEGGYILRPKYVKSGHMLKLPVNREYIEIPFENFTRLNVNAKEKASKEKKEVALRLIDTLSQRFGDYVNPIFEHMSWFDPKNWSNEKDYGVPQIKEMIDHFKEPINQTAFEEIRVMVEWKRFQNFVKVNFGGQLASGDITAKQIWEKTFKFRRLEYPNICLLAEIIIAISGSNSSVERSFSLLTNLMSDRRLKLRNSTVEALVIIKGNDRNWSEQDKEKIISTALAIHLAKIRKKKVDPPPKKLQRLELEVHDDERDLEDSESEDEFFESSSSEEDTSREENNTDM